MIIDHGVDGSVRETRAAALAGSSLTLDQAVRNVVAWGVCTFDEAVQMASANPRAALAAVAGHHRIVLPPGRITWTVERQVNAASLGVE